MNDWIKEETGQITFYALNCAELSHSLATEASTNHISRWYMLDKIENLTYNLKMLKRAVEEAKK